MKTPNHLSLTATLCLLMMSWLSPIAAQANWWEQGAALFEGFQNGTTSSKVHSQNLPADLTSAEIENAFKQALKQGSEAVVNQLSVKDGFNADPSIHIPLPESLKKVQTTLAGFGMSGYLDDLETRLNRAAENATPKAKMIFIDAIHNISFADLQKIYHGPEDSATQYLKKQTSPAIRQQILPLIENALNQVGAITTYDQAIDQYRRLPFVPDVKADLQRHVAQKTMDGLFFYLARQEAEIRQNPIKQTTDLLKKVFGS